MKRCCIVALFFFCLACAACSSFVNGMVSVVEKAGMALDGSLFAEKTTAQYEGIGNLTVRETRAKDGTTYLLVSLAAYPFVTLRTTTPDERGEVKPLAFQFLAGSYDGWNEFTLELTGRGVFEPSVLSIKELEPVAISAGKLLHSGRRLSGEDALVSLRNREARIEAIVQWMRGITAPKRFASLEAFEAYWQPLLVPEVADAKERPVIWEPTAETKRGEGVAWNSKYTASIFPQDLWELRGSGALLRDWEEASAWIYFVYDKVYIIEQFSKSYILRKVK
jgi:hypothetical protein